MCTSCLLAPASRYARMVPIDPLREEIASAGADEVPMYAADLDAIRSAARRIAGLAHRTPVMTCATLDRLSGRSIFFKCEQFQKVGAFKFRGACNAVARLDDATAARGVVTHSSGNHA